MKLNLKQKIILYTEIVVLAVMGIYVNFFVDYVGDVQVVDTTVKIYPK